MSVDQNNHANGRFEDITGWIMSEHGVPDSRLTVLKRAENKVYPSGKKTAQWLCQCSCPEQGLLPGHFSPEHAQAGHCMPSPPP